MSVFVASKQKLVDLEILCKSPANFSISGVVPTYNIKHVYVNVMTSCHMFFHTSAKVHPVMTDHVKFLLQGQLHFTQTCQRKLLVFGTDSETNVYQVLQEPLDNAYYLLCDIPLKGNM